MDFSALQDSLQYSLKLGSTSGAEAIHSRYRIVERIGKGAYGEVWRGERRYGGKEQFAIKQVQKQNAGAKGLQEVMGEVETMSILSHPNVVKLEETFQDESNVWIVMEYLPAGSLQEQMSQRSLPPSTTRRFITQLLLAIEYIHEKGVVHRDLKPANCLLSNNDLLIKVSDFGFSVLAGTEQCLSRYCGTIAFMAPEILLEKHYGKPVDMWALGVIAYLMMYERYPFQGSTNAGVMKSIVKGRYQLDADRSYQCVLFEDFISHLLAVNPNKRLTAKEALKHGWIKAGMEEDRNAHFQNLGSPRAPIKRRSSRWRAACLVVIAVHRIRYLQRLHRLRRIGLDSISVLCDYCFLATGSFKPKTTSLDCSRTFEEHPMAIMELLPMIESSSRITHVDLRCNNINSLALIQSILKTVVKHPTIRSLDLSNNPIPAVAGRAFLRLARNSTCRIFSINLGNTSIAPDTISQMNTYLKEKHPGIPMLSTSTSTTEAQARSCSRPESENTASATSPPPFVHSKSSPSSLQSRHRKRHEVSTKLPPIPRFPWERHLSKPP